MSKYHAVKTKLDGYTFDSKKEAARYQELKLLEQAGKITRLEIHPEYYLWVNSMQVCKYIADFRYIDCEVGGQVVEDVKGVKTAVYRLKKKLMKAIYGIEVFET